MRYSIITISPIICSILNSCSEEKSKTQKKDHLCNLLTESLHLIMLISETTYSHHKKRETRKQKLG